MKLVPVLLLLGFTLACSNSKPNNGNLSSPVVVKDELEFDNYVNKLSLFNKAPEGLGALLIYKKLKNQINIAGVCTWFLIDSDTAMTNSHCIPSDYKENKALNCGAFMKGVFQTKNGLERRRCKKVIHFSDITGGSTATNIDYAVIKLDVAVTNTKYYNFTRSGVSEFDRLEIHALDHNIKSYYSTFHKHNCLVHPSDIFGPEILKETSPFPAFAEEGSSDVCAPIGGNSGSPVVNSSANLVALLHGGVGEGEISAKKNFESYELAKNLAIMTNTRCAKTYIEKFDSDLDPIECSKSSIDKEKQLIAKIEKELKSTLEKFASSEIAKLTSIVEFEVDDVEVGSSKVMSFVPKCVKKFSTLSEEELAQINDGQLRFKVPMFTFQVGFGIDYYGNIHTNFKTAKFSELEYVANAISKTDEADTIGVFELSKSIEILTLAVCK